ncbi:MAG TPA: hypothetical protein PKH07_04340 [bacterium]|nr:hypothetical protein [bacterium]
MIFTLSHIKPRGVVLLMIISLLLAGVSPVSLQAQSQSPREAQKQSITLTVRMIQASDSDAKERTIPKELEDLKEDLSSFPYKVFSQLSLRSFRATIGSAATTGLAHGLQLQVTPSGSEGDMHSLAIRLIEGRDRVLLNMTLRTRSGSYTLIGGPKIGENAVVVLAISAK